MLMSLRISEPLTTRRARLFLRRWQKGPFRALIEALPIEPGGPVVLVDSDGVLLASLRHAGSLPSSHTGMAIGEPPVARLLGDVESLSPAFVDQVRSLVLAIADLSAEMTELSQHALERYRELSLLYDFSEKASSAIGLNDLLDVVLRKAVTVVRASGAALVTLSSDGAKVRVVARAGTVPEMSPQTVTRVIASGRTWVGIDGQSLHEVVGDSWFGTLACVPLRTAERSSGVLVVLAGPGRELRPEDHRLLTALASLAAMRIDHAQLVEVDVRKRELAALGHLASGIVHDFKNPLTAVRGFAEMIQMSEIPAEEHGALAQQIVENADRIWSMAEEILHFVRGNQATLKLAPTTGAELTERFRRSLIHGIPQRVELEVDLSNLGEIVVDTQKFERVIANLVRNACEAIIGKGRIEVRGESRDDQWVRIVVQDDGPGISPGIRDVMFDPFVTSGKSGGTGLGLAIVKKIVGDHGGTVTVHSDPGAGTRFVISLPRCPPGRGSNSCPSES